MIKTYKPTEGEHKSSEDSIQISVAQWLDLHYPKLLWYHPPNGGKRSAIVGAKLKQMGAKRGVPDIVISEPRGQFHGAYIEIKINSSKGKLSEHQKDFLNRADSLGYYCAVSYGYHSTLKAIQDYLKIV